MSTGSDGGCLDVGFSARRYDAVLIKMDPINAGSRRMVPGATDLPPGDAIGVHRHLHEGEIIVITRGTARVKLGRETVTAGRRRIDASFRRQLAVVGSHS